MRVFLLSGRIGIIPSKWNFAVQSSDVNACLFVVTYDRYSPGFESGNVDACFAVVRSVCNFYLTQYFAQICRGIIMCEKMYEK